jgi:hypothetical protein
MLGKKLIIPVVLIALACSLWADPPVKLQYQGKITQNDIALNGLYDMTFRLYSGSCGGTLLWTEIHNGASQVQVTNGLFNVLLGDITAFPEVSTTFNQPLWLQITVGATVMSPCEAFNPVPYAMYAISSPGSGSVNYWSPNGTHIYSNNTGNVGIGTTDPVGKLAVRQNMTAIGSSFTSPHIKIMASNTVDNTGFVGITYAASTSENYGWSSGALRSTAGQSDFLWKHHSNSALGTEYMRITSTGNVGIGTTAPSQKLELVGDMMISGSGTRTLTMQSASAGNVILDLKPNITGDQLAYLNSSYGFQFRTNTSGTAVDAVRIASNGNVGIGTLAPSTKLDVDGTVRIRGGSPAAGRVLTASDANGNATWTTGSSNFIQNLGGIGTTPQQARWRLSWPFTVSTSTDTLTYLLCRPASWNSDAVIYGNLVDIGTVTDGHGQAYYGKVDGSYSSLTGTTAFSGATFSAWDASGNARGGAGSVSISTLRTSFADHNATAYGLTGTANGSALTPSAASGANRMAIVGVQAELNGTINNPATMPDTFRVAALWAVDNKTGGTATSYAGFFDGNVYIDGDLTVTGTGGGGGTIGGSGTTNYITKWNPASTTISNSLIYDNGTNIGIGTTSPQAPLHVNSDSKALYIDGAGSISTTTFRGLGFQYYWGSGEGAIMASYPSGVGMLTFHTTNGTMAERMRIDYDGNVGIGTTGPTSKLEVNSASFPVARINNDNNSGETGIRFRTRSSGGLNAHADISWTATGTETGNLVFRVPYTNERMRIQSNGNVGIGTTGPLSKLSVNGAGNAAYALYSNGTSTANGGTALFGAQTGVSGTNTYYGVRGQSPLASASGAYCYGVRGDSYRGSYAANSRAYGVMGYAGNATAGYNYAIYGYLMGTGNGAAVYGTTSGDVAIPGIYAGYFNGSVRSTGTLQVGNYILPTADGASGQVLKTNGSGTLSWQADNTGAGGDNLGNHTATQNLNMNYWDIRNIDDLDGAESGEVGYIYLNWNCADGGEVGIYNSDLYVENGYGIYLGGVYRTSWPAGGSSNWTDNTSYINPNTSGTMDFRIYDNNQTYGVYKYQNSTALGGTWYGDYIYRAGTNTSTGYGLYARAEVYSGGGTGGTFTGVYGAAQWGTTTYGLYGRGESGTGYGVYGYGTSYGVYGQGGTWAGYFNGNVRSTGTLQVGNYILPTADGASGQVLKTNGSGTLSWQADNTGAGGDNLGNHTATMGLNMNGQSITSCPYYNVSAANGYGLRFWSSDSYKIHMGNSAEYLYGPVTDYSIKTNMSNNAGRGWTWGVTGSTPVAAINIAGNMQIAGDLTVAGADIYNGSSSYSWNGSGNWNTFRTPSGYIQLGPANASWAHIYSDKLFYFNQELYVNGNRVWHDGYHPAGGSSEWTDAGSYVYPNENSYTRVYEDNVSYGFYYSGGNPSYGVYSASGYRGVYGYCSDASSGYEGVRGYGVGDNYGVYAYSTGYPGAYIKTNHLGYYGAEIQSYSGYSYPGLYVNGYSYLNGNVYLMYGVYDGSSWGSGTQVLKSGSGNVYWAADETGGGGGSWTISGNYVYPNSNSNVQMDYNGSHTYGIYISKNSVASAPTNYFYLGGSYSGTDYSTSLSAGIRAYRWYGDTYSASIQGWSYGDYVRSAGVQGYMLSGAPWGALAYKNSGSSTYGVYYTNVGSGSGRPAPPRGGYDSPYDPGGVHTAIGAGGYGDLFGMHSDGNIYGFYSTGGRYASYDHGDRYLSGLDVHLQDVGRDTMAVLYTNVSLDATVIGSGVGRLVGGSARIRFDEAFAELISETEPIIITVTPIGDCNGINLMTSTNEGFTVAEANSGTNSAQFNWIAIAKRKGHERPQLPREVVAVDYNDKIYRGLNNDSDTRTDGEGLYFENGDLIVGVHESLIPDPNFIALKQDFEKNMNSRSYSEWETMFGSYGKEIGMSETEYNHHIASNQPDEAWFDEYGVQIPPEWIEEFKVEGIPMFTYEQTQEIRKQKLIDKARELREHPPYNGPADSPLPNLSIPAESPYQERHDGQNPPDEPAE